MKQMKTKILTDPHPTLRKTADRFDFDLPISDRITVSNQLSILLPRSGGYAIAAPQIGVSRACFIYKAEGERGIVFNPHIVSVSEETWPFLEGCLSIPGKFFPVERPRSIVAVGYNIRGEQTTYELTDLLARIFQHEIGHLNGELVTDHVSTTVPGTES